MIKSRKQNKKQFKRNQNKQNLSKSTKVDRPGMKLNDKINPNHKWAIMYRSVNSIDTTGIIIPLSPSIPQGFTESNRIGDIIQLKHLYFRYSLTYGDAYNVVRVLLIWQHGTPSTTPTLATFLDQGPSSAPDVYSMSYPFLHGNQYEVLMDRSDVVQNPYQQIVDIAGNVPINRRIVYQYNTTTSLSGELWLVMLSDSSLTPNVRGIFNVSVTYSDA